MHTFFNHKLQIDWLGTTSLQIVSPSSLSHLTYHIVSLVVKVVRSFHTSTIILMWQQQFQLKCYTLRCPVQSFGVCVVYLCVSCCFLRHFSLCFCHLLQPNDLYTWLKVDQLKTMTEANWMESVCVSTMLFSGRKRKVQIKIKAFDDPFFNHFRVTAYCQIATESWWRMNRYGVQWTYTVIPTSMYSILKWSIG